MGDYKAAEFASPLACVCVLHIFVHVPLSIVDGARSQGSGANLHWSQGSGANVLWKQNVETLGSFTQMTCFLLDYM